MGVGRRQREIQKEPFGSTLRSAGQLLRPGRILVIYQLARGQGQVLADNERGGRSHSHPFTHSLIHSISSPSVHSACYLAWMRGTEFPWNMTF